ncbi:hypothetical protein JCM24511_07364 [Saitozyma sp. JCM 24511]|nr:hypothetical protein JCM24511_07364 [Saitozyma sp. JCM 24511]
MSLKDNSEPSAAVQPAATFEDVKSNKKLIRKIDFHVLPCLALLYLISYVDRNTLANASILGYKTSLNLASDQYNIISTAFYFSYSVFEIPSQIIIQRIRPSLWLACLTAAWGLVTMLSGFTQNFGGAFAARFCLGICEAGFFPAAMMIVSMWYPRKEIQKRVAAFYAIGILSGSFTGLLAYAITYMDGVGNLASWRWLFILEVNQCIPFLSFAYKRQGLATMLLSLVVLFGLPDSPERAHWLTADERGEVIALRASVGGGHYEKEDFKWKHLRQALTDIRVACCVWLCMCTNFAVIGFSYALPSVLVQLGYSAAKAQLMTVPIYAVSCICVVIAAFYNDKIGKRSIGVASGFAFGLAGLIALYCLPKDRNPGVRYFFCMWVTAGLYAGYPSILAWCSNNAAGKGKKSMAMTIQLALGSLAVAAGNNVYLTQQAPNYQLGYGLGMAVCSSGIVVTGVLVLILRRDNAKKEQMDFDNHTPEQLEEMGDKAPTYRYIL